MIIEIYVDNTAGLSPDPGAVEETVNRLEIDCTIEHADDVSCIVVQDERTADLLGDHVKVIYRRELH